MRIPVMICFVFIGSFVFTQDSTSILRFNDFINLVKEHHPYTTRASLITQNGDAKLLQSKGAFDPKLFGIVDQKYFDDNQYYSRINSGLKIPSWFGITGEAGYTLNNGYYLNPENRTPTTGLWYAGIRLELGNGLIIDERRANLEKAKIVQSSSKLEGRILLNQLYRDASVAYFKWQVAYAKLIVYEKAYMNAKERLMAVKESAKFGDRPYIDTLEASISTQNRYLSYLNFKNELDNSKLKLEMYLWLDGYVPLELGDVKPEQISADQFNLNLEYEEIISNHPFNELNELESVQKQIDFKLKKEQLKPKITLKYNALSAPINNDPFANYSVSNYTWGASLEYPLLTRKERANVQMAKLNLHDQELKIVLTKADLNYQIKTVQNNLITRIEQVELASQLAINAERLYDAEYDLFNLGESSIFMINTRESQWLKSKIELLDLEYELNTIGTELKYQLMDFEL